MPPCCRHWRRLAKIGELDLLRTLYGRIVIPATVHGECCHAHSPEALADFFQQSDPWIQVVPDPALLPETRSVDAGEAAAISLAWLHRPNSTLIIDDKEGRRLCGELGLQITGTAGVLFTAACAGLIDFDEVIQRLHSTSFRLGADVVDRLRARIDQGNQ